MQHYCFNIKRSTILIFTLFVLYLPVVSVAQQPIREGGYKTGTIDLPVPQNAENWTPLSDALEPRVEGHSTYLNGKIYVFGGFQTMDIVPTDQNEAYTLATDSWNTFSPLPHPVTHVGSAEVDGKVWLAGGFALLNFTQIVDHVWIYDPQQNNWSAGPSLPEKRSAGILVRRGRKLHYISGLINRNDNTGDHFVLDLDEPGGPKTWTQAAPLPQPRDHLGGVVLGGKIYAIGGQFGHDIDPVDTKLMHVYDPATDKWTQLADLPYIRSHYEPGTIVVDGKIIIAGGRTGTQNCVDDVTEYDPVTDTWTHLFDMPSCLIAPSLKVFEDEMYLSHGGKVSVLFPTTDAFKRPFERNESDVLGFWPNQLTATLSGSEAQKLESVLWTHTDEANYTLNTTNLPSWITQITPTSGTADIPGAEIDVTVNSSGLTPGTYSYTLNASAPGYQNASVVISMVVGGEIDKQQIETGWNLVGIPVTPPNPNYAAIYGNLAPTLAPFAYENGYFQSETMSPGVGYWLDAPDSEEITLTGPPATTITYNLSAGWNLISGPACIFPLDQATGDTGIWSSGLAYGYTQALGYTTSSQLVPGKGYWIETDQAGTVTMNCNTL